MKEETFSLQTMLSTLYKIKNNKAKKRLIFDQAPIGGIGSQWVKAFFISLPIILYIGIFNPKIFAMLGIAQAIIFYIVFLSMIMIMIAGLTFINNNKVMRQIAPSWNKLFPSVELTQVLSSGTTPYKDFLKSYNRLLSMDLDDKELETKMKENFQHMQEENKEIYEMMTNRR
ncbi:MAG TPA: hypothetical protein ENK39_04530 [Epsilonproteobacteria bacterium]|nr:hypothetical protein [Campylobacterota bacterium]